MLTNPILGHPATLAITAALLAVCALVITACGGEPEPTPPPAEPTPTAKPTPDPNTPEGAYCDNIMVLYMAQTRTISALHRAIGDIWKPDQDIFFLRIYEKRWSTEITPLVNQLVPTANSMLGLEPPPTAQEAHSAFATYAEAVLAAHAANQKLIAEPNQDNLDVFYKVAGDAARPALPSLRAANAYCGHGYFLRNQ